MNRRDEGRDGRPNNGNETSLGVDGRQGVGDRERQRFGPLRQGLENTHGRRLGAIGAGHSSDIPDEAYSDAAFEAAERIAALLSSNANILHFPRKVGDV
jgi:hypothetical protein